MKDLIEFSQFLEIENKLEIKVGKVVKVEDIPKSNKLLKLTVDFGDELRTCVTNIKPHFNIDLNSLDHPLTDVKFAFIMNLKPAIMMGIESTVMIMPGQIEENKMVSVVGQIGTKLL